jgi:hypothetical protein
LTINSPSGLTVATVDVTFTSHSGAAANPDANFQPPMDDGGTITMSFFHRFTLPSSVNGPTDVLVVAKDAGGATVAQGTGTINIVKDEATAGTVAIMPPPVTGDGGGDDTGIGTDAGSSTDAETDGAATDGAATDGAVD